MARVSDLLRLLRPNQWVKNAFVVAPLFFSQHLFDENKVLMTAVGFIAFSLTASALYILNDLNDREGDRRHPTKRLRPLAAGAVSVSQAVMLVALLTGAVILLLFLSAPPKEFIAVLCAYAFITICYSLGLKNVSLLELFMVASGYVLRVIGGSILVAATPSTWILFTSGVAALLIVSGKRRADMVDHSDKGEHRKSLRGYTVSFLDQMIAVCAGMAILSYILFTVSDYALVRFQSTYLVATSVFVAFGILRYLQLVNAGRGGDDPNRLITRDPGIIASVLLWVLSLYAIIYF